MKARGIIEVTNRYGERMQVRKSAIKAVLWQENMGGFIKGIYQTGFFELLPSKQPDKCWKKDWYSLYSCENPFDSSDTRDARIKESDKKDRRVRAAAIRKEAKEAARRRAEAKERATKHRLRHERYATDGETVQ